MYTYITINFLTILFPFLFSFAPPLKFHKKWKYVFPALLIVGVVFVIWDHIFTALGIWGFNPEYLLGISFFALPLEEILFFFCIPFACLFIYELVLRFQKRDIPAAILKAFTLLLACVLFVLGIFFWKKTYTLLTFLSLAGLLTAHVYFIRSKYLGYFFQAFVISLIPFLVVNGILTKGLGFVSERPVVWYNDEANLAIRVMRIPVEDFFYSLVLLLANVTVYEFFKKKFAKNSASSDEK